ncbi:MAG: UDP-N-acetylglucosamine 4,6-dehydratase / UDP-D-quinovosamine 4-dehydrogenase, partial [Acidobacteria bacterium]|nr:UDP-N-acetylglucosamine 4,6-dehydratase / UDP-D-quinovosamine 4-dehydrogenase [Acidobacteriota bacterium]
MRRLLNPTPMKRVVFFVLADAGAIWLSLYLSCLNYADFSFDFEPVRQANKVFLYVLIIKLLALAAFRVYKLAWRFVGIADMANAFVALLVAEMVLLVMSLPSSILPALPLLGLPKRIFFVDGILSLVLILALRISKRVYIEVICKSGPLHRGENTLIIGAGNSGEMMLRDIMRNNFMDYYPIGFLDDDPTKIG